MQIINQYSAVWVVAILVVITGALLLRHHPKWPRIVVFGLLVVGMTLAWFILRPRQTVQLSPSQVQASIGQGIPVLLEFQSPY
jgi:uncharacterized membrane protein YccC